MSSELSEPLASHDAKRLIRQILDSGRFSFSQHAQRELAADRLTTVDCVNILRGGVVEPPEWENGSWRYHVRSARICVVVTFRSATNLLIVTAWRT